MRVRSLSGEDTLEKGMAPQSQYPCLENHMDRGPWPATVHRVSKSLTGPKRLSTHALHLPMDIYRQPAVCLDLGCFAPRVREGFSLVPWFYHILLSIFHAR